MNYIFFGSPEFAAIILEKLINAGFIPEAVVCNPDKPVGRKKIITPPPVKQMMNKKKLLNKVKIFQPENLNDLLNTKYLLLDTKPNLFIVAAYSKILPKEILSIPRLGTIGLHPSLLPKYRGATPIQTAILNGNEKTGTALFLIDEKLDHGAILINSETQITNQNYKKLEKELAEISANLLIEILPNIEEKIKNAKPQNESEATYTKKFKTEDAFIKPEDLENAKNLGGQIAYEIEKKIRAFNPEPGAYTIIENKRTKLLEAKIINNKLKLIKIQTEGKNPIVLM